MNRSTMTMILESFLTHVARVGGKSRKLVFERPANFKEIDEVENALGYELPNDFKHILLTISSHCEFRWFLPDKFPLPLELREIFCGELHWELNYIVECNQSKDGWVRDVFPNVEDEYDKVWHKKFAFQEVGNGDYLSVDLSESNNGKIIYLSHDDGEGHGYVMANSFSDLIRNWTHLGCVGAEDWQWLPFCDNRYDGINPNCPNAKLWKQTIGIEFPDLNRNF